ncbi:anti-repressor SinI family protein [Paenibacillus sp. J5C_2022]|uniref:anti-repressor SinI family protein n=1 Tax=Paenibacillus sp. J5C2022 TaxID=2977129 RepID=UPI0021CF5E2E|nr:anti-repressor SinI family protein [Paenibacillus sp. J5C2022]MCU6710286.1 anti-repressor SinI family protein [Paenibacillus sp. J5C2022]
MTAIYSDNQQQLDKEWVELILLARTKGLTKDQVQKALSILTEEKRNRLEESAV